MTSITGPEAFVPRWAQRWAPGEIKHSVVSPGLRHAAVGAVFTVVIAFALKTANATVAPGIRVWRYIILQVRRVQDKEHLSPTNLSSYQMEVVIQGLSISPLATAPGPRMSASSVPSQPSKSRRQGVWPTAGPSTGRGPYQHNSYTKSLCQLVYRKIYSKQRSDGSGGE